MEWIELGKLIEFQKKSKIKAGDGKTEGKYLMYTSSMLVDKYLDEYQYSEEALIMGTGGNASIHYSSGKFGTSTDCYVIYNKGAKALLKYIYYYLLGNIYILEEGFRGAGLKHTNQKYIKNIKIPILSVEAQEKIVKVLDQAQALIDKRKEQIEALDQLIESIFYTMFGDPVRNEKGWEVKEVQHLGKVGSSRRVYLSECVNEGIPFYRGQEVSRLSYGKKPNNELFISPDHYEELKAQRGIPKKGDLLLPSICPDGDIWMVDTNEPFYFKDGRVLWVELEDENINNFFIKSTLAHILRRNFRGISSGSTFSELKIFLLEKITIPIPPLALQNDFAQKVETIEKQKKLLEESLELMEENYKSIMDKAFKGQLFN